MYNHKCFLKLVVLVLAVCVLTGCGPKTILPSFAPTASVEPSLPSTSIEIPSASKVYPVVHSDVEMLVKDANGLLTSEDIETITYYIDVWASAYDTRNGGFDTEAAAAFASDESIATVTDNITNGTFDYSVTGTQILSIAPTDDGYIEVVYIIGLKGCDTTNEIPEGTYESVNAIRLTKSNDELSLSGIAFLIMAELGTLSYELDTIANTYSITPLGDYIG